MATHELKCDPGPFLDLLAGKKHCEVRRDDRGFREGDRLWLRETSLSAQGNAILRQEARYTGRELYRTITHIQRGYGLPDGIVVLSVSPAPESASQPGSGEAVETLMMLMRANPNAYVSDILPHAEDYLARAAPSAGNGEAMGGRDDEA